MKRVTSASVAAATAAATQVHHQARVQELFAPGPMSTTTITTTTTSATTTITTSTSATTVGGSSADEQDKQIATISTWLEPKGSPKISPGTNDDNNKAKSTAMSRLLAVDSDNYMLRKGAATATTSVNHGAAAPSSTASSSSQSSSTLNGSASVQLQRQMQSLAIGSATGPSILATYSNSGDHVGQLYDVTSRTTTSRSTATYVSPRWYTTGNSNQVTRQYREGAAQLEEQSLQQQQLQLQSRTTATVSTTTPATSAEDLEGEFGFPKLVCARLVSFHRYMCWCGTAVAEAVDANSVGDRAIKGGKSAAIPYEGFRRTVRDDNCSSSSLCCCMCGSLCPAECHACFHIVCSDYNGQHLCQWTTKGHALPGQVHDKDKVGKCLIPSRYITYDVCMRICHTRVGCLHR